MILTILQEYDELPVKKSRNETFEYNDYEGFKPNFNCSPAAFFICNSSDGKTRQFGAAHYCMCLIYIFVCVN